MEIECSRAYLLLEPELFQLQVLDLPTSTARQDALHCRRATADLYGNVVPELPPDLRYSKKFATHLQRSVEFCLGTLEGHSCLSM